MTYSATVELAFIANGTTYDVAQTGPDFFLLREPLTLATGCWEIGDYGRWTGAGE
jgi:hypothetical protein